VAREVALAHAGNVRSFAGTYINRRTADERARIGLDRLTPDEQVRLNNLVAIAIAAGPGRLSSAPGLGRDGFTLANRLQIHGEVSLTVGTSGHGRNFYGTSFFTTITDPETNLTIGLGFEQYHGTGFYGFGPNEYAYSELGLRNRGFDLGLGTRSFDLGLGLGAAGSVKRH
jgi:hypothetical protein